jgi:hypothetical protein
MGDGSYSAIGFGCILEGIEAWQDNTTGLDPERHAREVEQRLIDLPDREELADITLNTAEEARPDYLVIPLATTNTHQAWSWGVEELPIECPIPLDELVSTWMDVISPEALVQAQQAWETVRATAKTVGIRLPPGRLIYISDWD